MPQPKRQYGRSLGDFLDQETESGLSSAEEKLLAAVAKGEKCDLVDYTRKQKLKEELDKAVSAPEVIKLATDVVAFPKRIFDWHSRETKQEAEARLRLEARVKAQPRIVKEFITELPRFADGHAKGPKDLKVRVLNEPELLDPVLHELKERFDDELSHWRQVDPSDVAVRVRASFLRFLALGGDESAPVHEKGVQLGGAFVTGNLDFEGAEVRYPIIFSDCRMENKFILNNARLRTFNLNGSRVAGIYAARATFEGSVSLQFGFLAEGEVRFPGAQIGSNLECAEGAFRSLNCANARIEGDVFLSRGFKAEGEVRFHSAYIGNTLYCGGGNFLNYTEDGQGIALQCDGAKIMGTVWLTEGFRAAGTVRFIGAHVERSFYCAGGSFNNAVPQSTSPIQNSSLGKTSATALDLSGVTVKHSLHLAAGDEAPFDKSVSIRGSVELGGAHVEHFCDHPDSWPPEYVIGPDGEKLRCCIGLDGFRYGRFYGLAPIDSNTRKKWLQRQPPEHLAGSAFKPQPFEQLIKVMRVLGHEKEAREIAIFKQKCLAKAETQRASWWMRPFVWVLWVLFGTMVGYGYKPHRLIVGLFALWLGSALFYQLAAEHQVFAPTDSYVFLDDRFKDCRPPMGNWTKCAQLRKVEFQEHSSFNPWLYSLDVILPVVDLHQEKAWQPMRREIALELPKLPSAELPAGATIWLVWLEIIFGWAGSLFLVALITGMVKKD